MAKKKQFRQETTHYSGTETETPYTRARKEWDSRIGSARVQASNWRLVTFLALLVCIILAVLLYVSINMRKYVVYVAQVTKTGQIVNVSPLKVQYQPNQAQMEYFITHFIKLVRSLPLDPVVARKDWTTAYSFLTPRAAHELDRYMKKDNPIDELGKKTITVKIVDVNPLSDNSYQVDWQEVTTGADGQRQGTESYSGVFTAIIRQPSTQQQILVNPLGIYIDDFNVSVRDQ